MQGASDAANADNQAHSISRLIAEMAQLHVPTVGIIFGNGYSGGAIPLATTNVLLSVTDGVFNTIQPRGLANIARKYNLSWQECAKSVGVSPYELHEQGYLDGIIDYSPSQNTDGIENLHLAIVSSITAVERLAHYFMINNTSVLEHYQSTVERYLHPSDRLKRQSHSDTLSTITNPTQQPNVFGVAYRYLRYLGLRKRIRSTTVRGLRSSFRDRNPGRRPRGPHPSGTPPGLRALAFRTRSRSSTTTSWTRAGARFSVRTRRSRRTAGQLRPFSSALARATISTRAPTWSSSWSSISTTSGRAAPRTISRSWSSRSSRARRSPRSMPTTPTSCSWPPSRNCASH